MDFSILDLTAFPLMLYAALRGLAWVIWAVRCDAKHPSFHPNRYGIGHAQGLGSFGQQACSASEKHR